MSSSAVPQHPARPLDTGLVGAYIDDHLAGAVAGLRRMRRTAERLAETPAGRALADVADEVSAEQEELRAIARDLGVERSVVKQGLAWLGERVSRLAGNGRWLHRSPMTMLLEVELLRSGVVGKLGLWQTLAEIGPELGLDADRMAQLAARTRSQIATIDSAHSYVRVRALRAAPDPH